VCSEEKLRVELEPRADSRAAQCCSTTLENTATRFPAPVRVGTGSSQCWADRVFWTLVATEVSNGDENAVIGVT
jgi:hypothetical protein